MTTQSLHINDTARQSETFSDLFDADDMSPLYVVASLASLFILTAVSSSPVVEERSSIITTILGVLSLLIILPILISGIINLILIIS